MLSKLTQYFLMKHKISINIDNKTSLLGFILYQDQSELALKTDGHKIFETKSSIVLKLSNDKVLKCLKIRHWTEYHKVLLGKNRAKEEVFSNYKMREIGLKVPKIKYYGIFSNIFNRREFSSFYCMETISSDYSPGDSVFNTLSNAAKKAFTTSLSSDLSALKNGKYVYSDLSLRNFMLNSKGDYYWIDTQIKKYSQKNKFKRKFNYSLHRFINDPLLILCTEESSVLNSQVIR